MAEILGSGEVSVGKETFCTPKTFWVVESFW